MLSALKLKEKHPLPHILANILDRERANIIAAWQNSEPQYFVETRLSHELAQVLKFKGYNAWPYRNGVRIDFDVAYPLVRDYNNPLFWIKSEVLQEKTFLFTGEVGSYEVILGGFSFDQLQNDIIVPFLKPIPDGLGFNLGSPIPL